MAEVSRKRTLVNPRRKRRNKAKRKMSPKQIAHFGTKSQRAALKANRKPNSKPVVYNKPKKAIRSTSCGLTHAHIQRLLSHVNTEDFDDIEDLSDVSEYILETLAQERNCKLSASEKQFVTKTIQDSWYQEQLRNI